MTQIVYQSRAAQPLTRRGYDELLRECRRRNAGDGITGLLVSDGLTFLQAFEGPTDAATACLARIASDRRHHSIVMIRKVDVPAREFGTFAMLGLLPGLAEASSFVDRTKEAVEDVYSPSLQALFIGYATLGRSKMPQLRSL
ncbi:BLUF domain-containing protein [Sphingomonas gellani]|uniref:BLUF domain-containing protein n=1 Tax=Sphingomonas gellani TaxID=1166340 RepID=UPI00147DB3E0|nr:BLUF domain-containing protein [Sphingomonas gellani]